MEFVRKKIELINCNDIISLNDDERRKFYNAYSNLNLCYMCKIEDKTYHKKRIYKEDVVNELLGRIISEYLGDDKLETKIIRDEGDRFSILTENFIDPKKKYINLHNNIFHKLRFHKWRLDIFSIDLFDEIKIDKNIYKINKDDLVKLKYKLKMMIISDYIRKHSDRDFKNFMFEYDKSHCRLMPLYDFEFSFLQYEKVLRNTFNFNISNKRVNEYIRNDNQFQELLELTIKMDMKLIFDKLFDEYPVRMIKEEIINYNNIVEENKEKIKRYSL